MKKLCVLLLPLIAVSCIAGCTITTKNSGTVGLRFGTDIAFYSTAAQTAPEPATINSEAPALVNWLFPPKEETKTTVIDATVIPPSN